MFMFNIQHLPGKINHTPDCISRVHDDIKEEDNITKLNDHDESDTELGATISTSYIASAVSAL